MLFNGSKEDFKEAIKASWDYARGDSLLCELGDFRQKATSTLKHMHDAEVAKVYKASLIILLKDITRDLEDVE